MSFFKNKEEVIDLQLTPYGKQILSNGNFKPVYYAFFDDDMIYDSNSYNLPELQNDTQTRILECTPYLKTQYKFSASSTNYREELDYSNRLGIPLNNADDSMQYAPAFNLNFTKGIIDRVELTGTNRANIVGNEYIPQIYLKPEFINIIIDKNYSKSDISGPEVILPPRNDDSYVRAVPKEIIFDIFEYNVENLSKNFDIEIHKIHNGNIEKLNFENRSGMNNSIIFDDMLISKGFAKQEYTYDVTDDGIQEFTETDLHMVNSYFNIIFDDISEEIKPNRLYIYEPVTDISPKGNNC